MVGDEMVKIERVEKSECSVCNESGIIVNGELSEFSYTMRLCDDCRWDLMYSLEDECFGEVVKLTNEEIQSADNFIDYVVGKVNIVSEYGNKTSFFMYRLPLDSRIDERIYNNYVNKKLYDRGIDSKYDTLKSGYVGFCDRVKVSWTNRYSPEGV